MGLKNVWGNVVWKVTINSASIVTYATYAMINISAISPPCDLVPNFVGKMGSYHLLKNWILLQIKS
jgi:hypothetical protein